MGISLRFAKSEANNSVNIGPGDDSYKASGDMIYDVYYTPPSSSSSILLAPLNFYVRAYYDYSTTNNRYEFRTDLYVYRSYYNSSYNVGYVSFPVNDIYFNGTSHSNINVYGDNYNSATRIRDISESYTRVAYSSTFTYSSTTGSNTANYAEITIKYGDSSSLGYSLDTTSSLFPHTTVYYSANKFKCTFSSNGSPSSYTSQDVYYSKSPNNPGTPSSPASVTRNITVSFPPGKGTSSAQISTGTIIDT